VNEGEKEEGQKNEKYPFSPKLKWNRNGKITFELIGLKVICFLCWNNIIREILKIVSFLLPLSFQIRMKPFKRGNCERLHPRKAIF